MLILALMGGVMMSQISRNQEVKRRPTAKSFYHRFRPCSLWFRNSFAVWCLQITPLPCCSYDDDHPVTR